MCILISLKLLKRTLTWTRKSVYYDLYKSRIRKKKGGVQLTQSVYPSQTFLDLVSVQLASTSRSDIVTV